MKQIMLSYKGMVDGVGRSLGSDAGFCHLHGLGDLDGAEPWCGVFGPEDLRSRGDGWERSKSRLKSIDIDIDLNRAIENARLSFDESQDAILRRLLAIDARRPVDSTVPRTRAPRSSGAYMTVIGTVPVEANSLKELLRRAILIAEKSRAGFIEQLARTPTPKGRFIVARTAASLYPKSPQLVEYADRLDPEWWYDTNVGRSQVLAYLRVLSRLLKLPHHPTIQKRSEKSALTLEDLGLT